MEFEVLIIGSDANAYYMARCFHEAYHKKAYLLAKQRMAFTEYSNILHIEYNSQLWEENHFIEALNTFALTHPGKKIVVISSNETYSEFIAKNKKKLNPNLLYNIPNFELIRSLTQKELFYKTYKKSTLHFPKTIYYPCQKKKTLKLDFMYPIIVKPSNVVEYNHLHFEGKHKIYKLNNEQELIETIDKIKKSGYKDTLIIQEYIPGDDSYLFDAVLYSNKKKKVKLISFAQIGLQEHSKSMVGNAAVLINGYNQFGESEKIIQTIKDFMEEIGYQGFAEFDMKYDYRDQQYKVLEINARQGRSSYYINSLGYNLVQILIDDLIYNKKMKYTVLKEEVLLSYVPKTILKTYIVNEEYKQKALLLWKQGKVVNPLSYSKDTHLKRKVFLLKRNYQYYQDYKKGYWIND